MKRSQTVRLTLVAGLALSGCGRRPLDPCEPATFQPAACEAATRDGGYYYGNRWYSHSYSHPYSYYYGGYSSYTRGGGSVRAASPSTYFRPGSVTGTTRGAFGATGSGSHAGGARGGS